MSSRRRASRSDHDSAHSSSNYPPHENVERETSKRDTRAESTQHISYSESDTERETQTKGKGRLRYVAPLEVQNSDQQPWKGRKSERRPSLLDLIDADLSDWIPEPLESRRRRLLRENTKTPSSQQASVPNETTLETSERSRRSHRTSRYHEEIENSYEDLTVAPLRRNSMSATEAAAQQERFTQLPRRSAARRKSLSEMIADVEGDLANLFPEDSNDITPRPTPSSTPSLPRAQIAQTIEEMNEMSLVQPDVDRLPLVHAFLFGGDEWGSRSYNQTLDDYYIEFALSQAINGPDPRVTASRPDRNRRNHIRHIYDQKTQFGLLTRVDMDFIMIRIQEELAAQDPYVVHDWIIKEREARGRDESEPGFEIVYWRPGSGLLA